jgi:hypothetical protein
MQGIHGHGFVDCGMCERQFFSGTVTKPHASGLDLATVPGRAIFGIVSNGSMPTTWPW